MPKPRDARILRRLQYFEAAARLTSVSLAAKELGVSPSAVSHQLSDLKRTIGEDLFRKSGQGLELTAPGRQLAQRLSMAFHILDSSVAKVIGSERPIVRIAACSSFGPYWLVPRLGEFRAARPDIDVEVRLYGRDPELTHASADCIVTAQDVKPGYAHVDLFMENSIAVAAPEILTKGLLGDVPLITTDTDEAELGADWQEFRAKTGEDWAQAANCGWLRCSHYILALETAKAGQGVALIPDFVASDAINNGHLVQIGQGSFNNEGRTYRACYKEGHAADADLQALVSWLKRVAKNGTSAALPTEERLV